MSREPLHAVTPTSDTNETRDYSACADAMQHALHVENVHSLGASEETIVARAIAAEIETLSDAIWHLSEADCGLDPDATITALAFMTKRRAEALGKLLK